jgi:L-fucose isomerase-like protein
MDNIMPRLGFFSLGRTHFDKDRSRQLTSQFRAELEIRGYEIVGGEDILWNIDDVHHFLEILGNAKIDLSLVFQATFTDSTMVLEIARRIEAPIAIWSTPEEWDGERLKLNSFTGMHLASHALHKNKFPFSYLYANIDDPQAFGKLNLIARAAHVVQILKSASIGVIGAPPTGFETCEFNSVEIESRFGVTLQQFPLEDFFTQILATLPERIQSTKDVLENSVENLSKLDQQAVDKTIATYESLLDLHRGHGLEGLAVRCWPEFFEKLGCSACGALSMAADQGIACSCEVDVLGTLTQLILQTLSGTPALGADLVGFDLEDNTAAIWHCGMAPASMANPKYTKEATTHSNRGLPLLMQFPLKPGIITLARLTQADEQIKLIISSGEMLDRARPFTGTCGVLQFEHPANQVLETIMTIGMEHHISFTYGNFLAELEVIAKLLALPIIYL